MHANPSFIRYPHGTDLTEAEYYSLYDQDGFNLEPEYFDSSEDFETIPDRQPDIRELERRIIQLERQFFQMNRRIDQIQKTVGRHTNRINRINRRLQVVEQRLAIPFYPYSGLQ